MKIRRFHCTVCGRFVPWNADSGVHYGNCTEHEPRDPEYYCKECAEENKQAVMNGAVWLAERERWYMPPRWAEEALEKIGL